ncbi:hypothetical protein AKJ09_10497 [Labilithrix luteola]|uniref:Uncharacterized protein n=1 Tax=Labilithrix luteola TaxID=1391654 RepID=A0A0K1QDJ5_9BACT|nr:hypothetical protein AKJ09_10497 [Labilithrix luteola]
MSPHTLLGAVVAHVPPELELELLLEVPPELELLLEVPPELELLLVDPPLELELELLELVPASLFVLPLLPASSSLEPEGSRADDSSGSVGDDVCSGESAPMASLPPFAHAASTPSEPTKAARPKPKATGLSERCSGNAMTARI